MGSYSSNKSTTEMGKDSFRGKVAIAYGIEHGGMSAKESTPTHTDGCEYGDGVAIYPTMSDKAWYKTQGRAHGTKSRDRECYEMWVVETKEPFKHKVYLIGKPRQ